MLTGEDQHIQGKTLADYYDKIIWGSDIEKPYDFLKSEGKLIKHLRRHCKQTRKNQSLRLNIDSNTDNISSTSSEILF